MKTALLTKLGGPETLKIVETEKPEPTENQLLIKVSYSSINASDYAGFEASVKAGKVPLLYQLKETIKDHRIGKGMGMELSGTVETVGKSVTNFQKGDRIFGFSANLIGAWGEYAIVEQTDICLLPPEVSLKEAATLPVAGVTALSALHKLGDLKGKKLLIYGASGGVGLTLLQIASQKGALITAVCSSRNISLVQAYGAQKIFDYQKDDLQDIPSGYDAIISVNGYQPLSFFKQRLTPNGRYIALGGAKQGIMTLFLGPLYSLSSSKKIGFTTFFAENKQTCLVELADLLENKEVQPLIDAVYPLEQISSALNHIIQKHGQGKIVIQVSNASAD